MKLFFFLLVLMTLTHANSTEERSIDELLDEAKALDVNKDK